MPSINSPRRLTSWKEIAVFLGKGERTVKRWEAERGLPVHRLPGKAGGTIYADPDELTRWLTSAPAPAVQDEEVDEPIAPDPPPALEAAPNPAPQGLRGRRGLWWGAPVALAACVLTGAVATHLVSRHKGEAEASSRDPQAAELYREGVHDWNTRSPAGLNRAVDEFTQAIVRDPRYAEAYVGLANCYILLREFASMPDADAYPRAQAAAERAVALNPKLPRAHSALAFVLFYWRWKPAEADREFRTALQLDSNDALIHHWYANTLKLQGRPTEAQAEIGRAQALDPDSSAILADKALILVDVGKLDEGRAILQRMEQVDPSFGSPHAYLADLDLLNGDCEGYLQELRWLANAKGGAGSKDVTDTLDRAFRTGGAKELERALLKSRSDLFDQGQGTAYEVARAHALMGDEPETLAWLRKAIARREPAVLGFTMDPAMARLNRKPEFASIRAAVLGHA